MPSGCQGPVPAQARYGERSAERAVRFRRASVNLDRLQPSGFKVLLDILVRNPAAQVAEVAYRFEPRAAGESKASLREGVMFLRHVARLRTERLASSCGSGRSLRPSG